MSPWTLRNAVTMHQFIPVSTQAGFTLAGTYNATTDHGRWPPADRFPAAWIEWWHDPTMGSVLRSTNGQEAVIEKGLRSKATTYAADHPAYVVRVAWWNTRRLLDLAGSSYVRFDFADSALPVSLAWPELISFWIIGSLALAGAFTRRARRAPLWLRLVVPSMAVSVVIVAYIRFRAPLDPFFLMLSALVLVAGADRIAARRRKSPVGGSAQPA